MDDLDHLLAGRDGLEDVLADAGQLHPVDELAGDFEMHVGGQQGGAHFLEGFRHVGLGQRTDPAQVAQGPGQFFGQAFEHESRKVGAGASAASGKYRLPAGPSAPKVCRE